MQTRRREACSHHWCASISICMCERVLSELTTANSWQEERVPNVSVRSGQGPRLPPLSPPSDFSLPSVPLVVNISSLRPGHVLTWLYLCLLDTSWTFGGFSTNVRGNKKERRIRLPRSKGKIHLETYTHTFLTDLNTERTIFAVRVSMQDV